jgi:hypothetical protein
VWTSFWQSSRLSAHHDERNVIEVSYNFKLGDTILLIPAGDEVFRALPALTRLDELDRSLTKALFNISGDATSSFEVAVKSGVIITVGFKSSSRCFVSVEFSSAFGSKGEKPQPSSQAARKPTWNSVPLRMKAAMSEPGLIPDSASF